MKVAFIQTPSPYLVRQDAQMPLGILYLATIVKAYMEHEVKIFRPKNVEDMKDALGFDVICFSATTLEYPMARECAMYIRDNDRTIKILIGGTHVTATKNHDPMFDAICIGEGEYRIQQMISDIEKDSLHKYYETSYPINVDAMPIPDRRLIPGTHGGEIFSKGGQGRNENFITSRGCAHNCAFCASKSMWKRRVRFRSIESIRQELAMIRHEYGLVPLRICDDNMTTNKERLTALCRELKHFGFKWRCSVRAEDLTPLVCETMYDSGCREISPGIESGDQNVLDFLNKRTSTDMMFHGCRNAKEAGIYVRALFMIGTPGETKATPELNIEYINRLKPDKITISTFIPLPGTDIYNDPAKFNCEILSHDFRKYNKDYFIRKNGSSGERTYEPLIHNKLLTIEQMKDNVRRMEGYLKEYEVNKG